MPNRANIRKREIRFLGLLSPNSEISETPCEVSEEAGSRSASNSTRLPGHTVGEVGGVPEAAAVPLGGMTATPVSPSRSQPSDALPRGAGRP